MKRYSLSQLCSTTISMNGVSAVFGKIKTSSLTMGVSDLIT